MNRPRRAGVLLHPTSLPGPFGRGDLGPQARAFVDWLRSAGQAVWQVLPLGPPGWGGSPYAAASAFAGDTALVSLEDLVAEGFLGEDALPGRSPEGRVDPDAQSASRASLTEAWRRFDAAATGGQREDLARFEEAQAFWLEEYALFVAIKAAHGGGASWECFPADLALREPAALERARVEHRDAARREVFAQYLFDRQWRALRDYAKGQGVSVLGDLPIFVARDSADVWAWPDLFQLDERGEPTVVAGVPPDAFSEDGQLWGNPLYDLAAHERQGYTWWTERFRRSFELADWVRVDHFRGFASTWEIPAAAETAADGSWVPGLGLSLFEAVAEGLGVATPSELPVVAEDLGHITPDVEALLEATGFPGMKILQFAFYDDDPEHPFKPENHPPGCVVYTGTHDNQTTHGWFTDLDASSRARVRERVGDGDIVWGLIELALSSPAWLALIPAQDLLGLGDEARFNTPGEAEGNWSWRLLPGQLGSVCAERLRALTRGQGRLA